MNLVLLKKCFTIYQEESQIWRNDRLKDLWSASLYLIQTEIQKCGKADDRRQYDQPKRL